MKTNTRKTTRTWPRLAVPSLLAACVLLTTAACGGGDGGGGGSDDAGDGDVAHVEEDPGADATAEEDPVAQAQAYADCLRDNGVQVQDPDPETGELALGELGGGGDREALAAAFDACRELAPPSVEEAAGGDLTEEQQESMRDFADCMRGEGIDMPDPGPQGLDPGALDLNDPATEAALEVCQGELGWRQ